MRLVNGINQRVPFRPADIRREASQDEGDTSIVFATCDDGTEANISQHESGDWDISVNENPVDEFDEDQADEAVHEFIRLCLEHNR